MHSRSEAIMRGDCYKLLAACFYQPDKILLLEERVCQNLGALLARHAPDAGKAATEMADALQALSQEQLRVDHAVLFVGPFELIAAPYGSVYLDQGRRLMGDSTLGVLRFYQNAGLAVDVGEPADHLVIELEFMYYLANKEAAAIAEGREEETTGYQEQQLRFFTQFLQPWVLQFCRLLRSGTTNPFYSSLADCLGLFLMSSGSRPMPESVTESPFGDSPHTDVAIAEKSSN